jgi:N-acetyl-D-muramate 6-phosphate phosphatase
MGIEAEKIQAILFDIDGTLSDSDDLLIKRIERWIKPIAFFLSPEKKHAFARWLVMMAESPGNYFYNLADRFDLDSFFIKMLNEGSLKKKHRIKEYWMVSGSKDLLEQLSDRYHLGVVSARDEPSTMAFLNQFMIKDLFGAIVTSQTCRYTKPFPDPMFHAAKTLGVDPKNCLMVGDTTVDMKSAKLAGMQAVGVLCGFGHEKELRRAGADMILPTTSDLPQLLNTEQNYFR